MSEVRDRITAASAPVAAVTLSRSQLFAHVSNSLRANHGSTRFNAIADIELQSLQTLRPMLVAGTVLEPVDQALASVGVATNGTAGGVIDAMSLSKADMHQAFCHCLSATATGDMLADRLDRLAPDVEG
ncbi:MAG: hypothetical protein AB199_03145 [Parcubacteria bacterium C7867-004]|nr:MAG: hypothetical protein AB199_03145 [Parcubacteria bacterium C7867-004]